MMSNNTDHSVLSNMDQATLLAALSQQRQSSSKTKAKLVSFDEITKASDAAASVESAIIVCPNCQCKILRPRVGTYMVYQESHTIPLVPQLDQFTLNQSESTGVLVVSDMMAFENIGFSKPVPSSTGDRAPHPRAQRYLCCADCDLGPLGYQAGPKEFIIVASRVGYIKN